MSFNDFKSNSYGVGGRQRSVTTKIYGKVTYKGSKVLIGYCSICNRKKSINVGDNAIEAEVLVSFFRKLGRFSANGGKK